MLSDFFFKKKSIFVDKNFIDSQFLWVLPIIEGYSDQIGIESIIFQKKLPNTILEQKYIKEFLIKKKIIYLENKIFNLTIFSITIVFSLFFFPFFVFFFNKKKLLLEKSWFRSQLYHAFWDTALMLGKDGEIEPSLQSKFKSFCMCLTAYCKIVYLKKIYNIHTSFLSHSVYSGRVFLANLRKDSLVFCQSAFNLYKQNKYNDECWSILRNTKILKKILKKINNKNINYYWNKRINGKGESFESNKITKFIGHQNIKNANIIMLHVFRDSAFNFIDTKRIFTDYIDWVYKTLEILKYSKEDWYIRVHPFSHSWGEESKLFVDEIKKKLNYNKDNVKFLDENVSNIKIFENAKKIVTFSGTAFLESACYGKKAIIISDVIPSFYQDKLALKPKSIDEYKKLLLQEKKVFLNKKFVHVARKILFCRENITNLRLDTGGFFVYRNDSKKVKLKEFQLVKNNIISKIKFFRDLGFKYSIKNFRHSISSKFVNRLDF